MEEEKPIGRIKLFAKLSKLSIKKFEEICKLKPNVVQNAINRKSNMHDTMLGPIMQAFPNLSMRWVLLGQGEMLLNANTTTSQEMRQDPDFKEILSMIERIDDQTLSTSIKYKIFELCQNNSTLKSELLKAYKLVGNI